MSSWSTKAQCVNAWLERVGPKVPAKSLLLFFDQAMGALWRRAHPVLGEVTLGAIADRVLWNAVEQYSFLSPLKVEKTGVTSAGLEERTSTLDERKLREGLRFTLVEFLTVIGSLTGEILTPSLQAELLKLPQTDLGGNPPTKRGHES
jgi:hypothetical protein